VSGRAGVARGVRLSARHWEIEVDPVPGGGPGVRQPGLAVAPDQLTVHPLHAAAPSARVETLAAPRPGGRRGWRLLLAVDSAGAADPVGLSYVLSWSGNPGWRQRIELGATPAERPDALDGTLGPGARPDVDYTARDFDALNAMLAGVIGESVGPTVTTHVVSQAAALVELMAYLGDSLSFSQDAVATEAYLSTARRRISATRHAALLDYTVGQATSARTWVHLTVARPTILAARSAVLTDAPGLTGAVSGVDREQAIAAGALVFETFEPVELQPAGVLDLDGANHAGGLVPAGAVSVAVAAGSARSLPAAGDLILIAPVGPPLHGVASGGPAPAVPGPGQVVRLTEISVSATGSEPAPSSSPLPGRNPAVAAAGSPAVGGRAVLSWDSADRLTGDLGSAAHPAKVWVGNLVLADHGATEADPDLVSHLDDLSVVPLPPVPAGARYWPRLPRPGITWSAGLGPGDDAGSATAALAPGRDPLPAVELLELTPTGRRAWAVTSSLLDSRPVDLHAVVEVESDGTARLRFGDGTNGLLPAPGTRFAVRYRTGGGSVGNVPAGSVRSTTVADPAILAIRNPMAALGGADPESITSIRLGAPVSGQRNQRAVTPGDYAAAARAVPGVLDAQAGVGNDGSGSVAVVYVRGGDWSPDPALLARVHRELDLLAVMGVRLEVRAAVPVPVAVDAQARVEPGYGFGLVGSQADAKLTRTFLQPSSFTFGTPLYESDVVSALFDVKGILDARVRTLSVAPGTAGARPPGAVLRPSFGRILRIDNDPLDPAKGTIEYHLVPGP
jgi:hypothetical protein